MKKKFRQFFTRLVILSVLLWSAAFLLSLFLPQGIITPAYTWLVPVFFIVTAIVHFVLLRITELNPRKFVGYFMLATFVKLMNYIIVVFVYVFIVRAGILQFILAFFALYIIYTIFEVVTILTQTKDEAVKR